MNKKSSNAARLKRHARIRNKISGTAERPRLCVFRSSVHIYAQIIDDVTDAIDETALDLYMYHIEQLPPLALKLGESVKLIVEALAKAVGELKNFKKSDAMNKILSDVNRIETEADDIYGEGIRLLFSQDCDYKDLIAFKAIYESLESCCDLCEHAADVISQIIIKNT